MGRKQTVAQWQEWVERGHGRLAAQWDGQRLTFAACEYGVAPGQSAVFYDGERLLGGGTITATMAAAMDEAVAA